MSDSEVTELLGGALAQLENMFRQVVFELYLAMIDRKPAAQSKPPIHGLARDVARNS
ncbi:hypothetical protein [Methylobacter psychrophilus]|uniref:hypothetical protein n=1 Tax=Methylobacter psychrophilus TaxID=96941 RepID=UPI0021D4B806|nr:hypothetical protein [Methylobacter psychrophilus]